MNKVAIPKIEYLRLKRRASAYQKLMGSFFQTAIREPIEDIVVDFKKTGLYTDAFLKDLEDGLRRSSRGKQ